ncbi:MAG: argininosuccinate lyase [Anaerolineales bacterium]|nr:argininosuccinate lyase [Anaerolineales bacterium]
MPKLWGGRMKGKADQAMFALNASYAFDCRLYSQDIRGSIAWTQALHQAGVLSEGESSTITDGLAQVLEEFQTGTFIPVSEDEDIHTAVERRLTELVGAVGGKLHTGRSRNDQVATDFRIWVMETCDGLCRQITNLAGVMVDHAAGNLSVPMPGYTHLQPAQPVTWGAWLLAFVWPLCRDRKRFEQVRASTAVLPLGSGALAGTTYPINRTWLAETLGFKHISQSSLDAVSDRDFALEFLFASATLGIHLSKLAESLILFNTREFGFITLDDAFSTGSSLMPQKKNPDPLELARGKSGRLIGNLTSLLVTLKGLPSTYDKDLQEDKEPVFDSADTLLALLPVLAGLIHTMKINPEAMGRILQSELLATDLADDLVEEGIPFREAHAVVGRLAAAAEQKEKTLSTLSETDLEAAGYRGNPAALRSLTVEKSLARRSNIGGVSSSALSIQLEAARAALSTQRGG